MQASNKWMLASRAIRADQDGAERIKALMLKAIRANDREAAGLQPQATLSPIRRALSKLDPLPAHCLVQHLAGGSWTAENIAKRCEEQERSAFCTLCGENGTLRHRLWKCPAWTKEREFIN
eukprot:1209752-Amphidinium_carterae.2